MQSPIVPHTPPSSRRGSTATRIVPRPILHEDDFSFYHPLDEDQEIGRVFLSFWNNSNQWSVLLTCFALVGVLTTETMLRKANASFYMLHYRTMLNQILVGSCAVAFFGVLFFQRYVQETIKTLAVSYNHLLWFFVICIFDTVAMFMIILSQSGVTAPLATLLTQGAIPMTMIASALVLHKRYKLEHYLGALILLIGLCMSLIISWNHQEQEDGNTENQFWWVLVFFLANIPIALGSILKEIILTDPDDTKRADMHQLNAWVSLFQFILGMFTYPIAFLLQEPGNGHHVNEVPSNMVDGLACWLAGENSIALDDCGPAVWAVWTHIIFVVVLNMLILLVILHGSATLLWISSAVTIPMTSIVSALPFMGNLYVHFQWVDIISIFLTIGGLLVYRSKPEV